MIGGDGLQFGAKLQKLTTNNCGRVRSAMGMTGAEGATTPESLRYQGPRC